MLSPGFGMLSPGLGVLSPGLEVLSAEFEVLSAGFEGLPPPAEFAHHVTVTNNREMREIDKIYFSACFIVQISLRSYCSDL